MGFTRQPQIAMQMLKWNIPIKAGLRLLSPYSPLLYLLLLPSCNQEKSPPGQFDAYIEAEDPHPGSSVDWGNVEPGLHAAMGSIDVRYMKSAVPALTAITEWRGTAWKGEKVSAQLVLWSKDPVARVGCTFSDFVSKQGQKLSHEIARARFVRYVLTDEFADGCSKRNPEDYAVSLSADALDNTPYSDMEGECARPVWITIQVPADAVPGIYASTMQLVARGEKTREFSFQLEVLPQLLPAPSAWKFHLDLWQHPLAIAKMYQVEPWSPEHWELLRPYAKMLADAGQKVITAAVIEKPWGTQTEWGFESMIKWTKKAAGDWTFDYTIFDSYVQFMMDMGVNRQINCYSLIPWTEELIYYNEANRQHDTVGIKPGSLVFAEMWTPFLRAFSSHLKEKGWHKITLFAMDERNEEDMQNMLRMMDEVAPDIGVALADSHGAYKLFPNKVKDLSVSYTNVAIESADIEARRSMGYPTTYYVCCVDEFPNTFTFSPPVDAVYLGWYASAAGYDGLLRWSFTSWVKDPLHDSRFRSWPAGDTYMVYPGARSSIRYERLVEGIQDAEKIRILREKFKNEVTDAARVKLLLLDATVARFNSIGRPGNAEDLMRQGKKVLVELSR